MSKHIMQHPQEPTWCIKCGRFDVYCADDDCEADGNFFDSRKPENYKRMAESLFGKPHQFNPTTHEIIE